MAIAKRADAYRYGVVEVILWFGRLIGNDLCHQQMKPRFIQQDHLGEFQAPLSELEAATFLSRSYLSVILPFGDRRIP